MLVFPVSTISSHEESVGMLQSTSLKARLLAGFVSAALVPLLVATVLAATWYRSSLEEQAQRALGVNADTASAMLAEQLAERQAQIVSIAGVFSSPELRTAQALPVELERQSAALNLSYLIFVDDKSVVKGSTSGELGHVLAWEQLERVAKGTKARSFVGIVPITELVPLEQASQLELRVAPSVAGSAQQSEAVGALSVIAAAPVVNRSGSRVGTIVGVKTLKLDDGYVDSVAQKVGGAATLFQNGVRVATTVDRPDGKRDTGTAVRPEVRTAVLEAGERFVGEERVDDRTHLASYEPIRDVDGDVIGMTFVAIDKTPYGNAVNLFTLGMTIVTILGVALATAIAYIASRSIATPIYGIISAADQVATGDLTVNVPEEGFSEAQTMGRTFNSMTGALRDLIGNVGASASALDSVSGEIGDAVTSQADSASAQASAVAEATATLEELDRSFGAVAEGARRVREIAEDSLESADTGRNLVGQHATQVAILADSAGDVLTSVDDLQAAAQDIGQFTTVIRSVAEQTKILALNAAIEAARAGEAGKGFGVVAAQIRTLADSVSLSVGQINRLVDGIQVASKGLAENAERQVVHGTETVQETMFMRDRFDEILGRMDNTAAAAREIAAAASQQQAATKQIVDVMHQVSQGVAATAASARQVSGAATDVKREAGALSSGLKGFRVKR